MVIEPSLRRFYDSEEERLRATLCGVRSALLHAGEKGRALENEVTALIRKMLPSEYGVSTGFVAYSVNGDLRLSSQLDVVIYDASRGASLVTLDTCKVLPLEVVYGYVEIKTSLDSSCLSKCLRKNRILRSMTERRFWEPYSGSPPETVPIGPLQWTPIRSFIFAFESRFETVDELRNAIRNRLKKSRGVHLHGVFVAGFGFFSPHRIHGEWKDEVSDLFSTSTHALTAFKVALIKSLATFRRPDITWSPDIDRYHYDFVELSESSKSA